MVKFSGGMELSKKLPVLPTFCGQMPRIKYHKQDIVQPELVKKILHNAREAVEETMMIVLFADTAAIKECRTRLCNLEEIGHRLDQKLDSKLSGRDQSKYLLGSLDEILKSLGTSLPYRTKWLPAKKIESTEHSHVKRGTTELQRKPEMKDKQKIEEASVAKFARVASDGKMAFSPRKAAKRGLVAGLEGKTTTLDTVSTAHEITSVSGPKKEAESLELHLATAASEPETETETDDVAPQTIEKPEPSDPTMSRPSLEHTSPGIMPIPSPSTFGASIESVAVEPVEARKSLHAHELETVGISPETTKMLEEGDPTKLAPSAELTSSGIMSITGPSNESESTEGDMATVTIGSVEAGLSSRSIHAHESRTVDVVPETMGDSEVGDYMSSGPSLVPTLPAISSSSDPGTEIEMVEGSVPVPETAEGDRMRIGPLAESSLTFEGAWNLFHQEAGEVIDNPDVHSYARGIVEQCSGMQLLIILTGRALAEEKDISVWESTFKYFLSPIKSGTSDAESVTPKLKFIYDRLKTYATKKISTRACDLQGCFLYCALFPQDQQVSTSRLVECWIHEGLIAENTVDARKIGHEIVKILVDHALLESVEDDQHVKMHRMIRDFALKLALQEVETRQLLATTKLTLMEPTLPGISPSSGPLDQYVSKAGAGITESPLKEKWEKAKMIFLMDNELSSLPEKLKCRNLLALFLQRNQCLREIPISFFDRMPSLQILDLSKIGITSLPKSVSKLKSLKELMIRDCEHLVKLPSEVGKLQRLEVLDLRGTEIDKLPIKTGQLASLKYMKISFYGSVDEMAYSKLPPKLLSKRIISRFVSMKTLGIAVTPGDPRWNKIAEGVTGEISKLSNIIDLHFFFPREELLDMFVESSPSWRGNNLKNFNFVVGHDVERMISRVPRNVGREYNQRGQCLRFVNGETIPGAVIKVLRRTTSFYLDHHLKIRSLSEFGIREINGLETCVVRECPEMERIVNDEELTLPYLERLSIHYLENFKCIWQGNLAVGSFACLKYLQVHTCRQLNIVVTSSMSQHLTNLEELVIEDCPAMTAVIQEDQDKIVKPGDVLLPRLKSLTLHYLPQLVCIWKGSWPSLERISFYHCPNLMNLDVDYDTKLKSSVKEIKAEKDWWSKLEWNHPSLSQDLQAYFISADHELLNIAPPALQRHSSTPTGTIAPPTPSPRLTPITSIVGESECLSLRTPNLHHRDTECRPIPNLHRLVCRIVTKGTTRIVARQRQKEFRRSIPLPFVTLGEGTINPQFVSVWSLKFRPERVLNR